MDAKRAWLSVLLGLLALPLAAAAQTPSIGATWQGRAQLVYDATKSGCEKFDIPDEPARAFRDYRGDIHLIATHSTARAMIGPSLDALRHDCHVVYRSPDDANPADYQDEGWLDSFHTTDGRRVVALLHSEYHAWSHPGMCANPKAQGAELARCWWNAITMAVSTDGGYSFAAPKAPANVVASLPYPYSKSIAKGPNGFQQPTQIVTWGGAYYTMIGAWPYQAQQFGACVLRTTNPFDAGSWRAWGGSGYTVQFIDPYVTPDQPPAAHVCTPVPGQMHAPNSINVYGSAPTFVALQFTLDKRYGDPGLYISASRDLINWSKATLIASTAAMQADEGPGKWSYGYVSLIDPNATDRDFTGITDKPYVYYVRWDLTRGNLARSIMRRQIALHVGG